jgi:hypothetical protein
VLKRQHVPRVLLSREEIWLVAASGARIDHGVPAVERRGRLALSAYALYSDAANDTEFAEFVFPVLLAMSTSRATTLLALVESVAAFDAAFLSRRIAICHELSMATLVEVDEYWPRVAFERLLSARANYLRIGANMMRGAARDPEKLRDLIELTDVARVRQLQIVGSSRDPAGDSRAVRAARIELLQLDVPRLFANGVPRPAPLRRDGGGVGTGR